jgi:hypothetical protein
VLFQISAQVGYFMLNIWFNNENSSFEICIFRLLTRRNSAYTKQYATSETSLLVKYLESQNIDDINAGNCANCRRKNGKLRLTIILDLSFLQLLWGCLSRVSFRKDEIGKLMKYFWFEIRMNPGVNLDNSADEELWLYAKTQLKVMSIQVLWLLLFFSSLFEFENPNHVPRLFNRVALRYKGHVEWLCLMTRGEATEFEYVLPKCQLCVRV